MQPQLLEFFRNEVFRKAKLPNSLDQASQISRILAGSVLRSSRLFEEGCLYAERLGGGVSIDLVRANEELVSALAETWDGRAM